VLRSDGSVWTWGGTDSSSGDIVPRRVALPLPDNTRITAIAASLSDTIFRSRATATTARSIASPASTNSWPDVRWSQTAATTASPR
jgi:hypothetical protein